MSYKIPAGTIRLIKRGGEIALHYNLLQTTSVCLLLSALKDVSVMKILKTLEVDLESIRNKIEICLQQKNKTSNNVTPYVEVSEGGSSNFQKQMPTLDEDSSRVIKLIVLEDKLAKGEKDCSELMLLALMHDRKNEAKSILAQEGITYDKVQQATTKNSIKNDFSFPNEDDSPYPNDGASSRSEAGIESNNADGKKSTNETPIIDNFGTDLTNVAQRGGLDPVVGREKEIQRIVQILSRRKKNNPIIIGEPGVGKSAIVEGLAQRIVSRHVPHSLYNKRIISLDVTSLVAGTQYRGQFEERLRRLIKEIKSHSEIILFIDEIHTIIGAGSAPGSLDAANILKPALARGEIQCIGATTTSEFKKTIEKDGALDRRFQKIMLEPTSTEDTLTILQNIKSRYEKHHNVSYTEDALKACVELTNRYITERALPDKAIDALDEAGARMHLVGTEIPRYIEEKERFIETLRKQKLQAAQNQNYELAANLRDEIQQATSEVQTMTKEWQDNEREHPTEVNETVVAEVISMMSGVPATRIATSEGQRLKGMKVALCKRVISQDKAVERLTKAIMRSRIGLKGNDRPIGTFLFVGPTGVGKTHLVKCLAEWMFGSKDALIRVDMSEYGEKYSVSRLVGAPPGYVGYEEGGQLTERVRRHPYSVILLDEIEKAHPDVFNTLLQVMDEGRLTDGNGTTVDFRNTIIILTSNSGTRQLREFGNGVGFERIEGEISNEAAESIILKVLRKQFAPEFLNRLDDIIMFNPLDKNSALQIADLELHNLAERLNHNGISLTVTEEAKKFVVDKGFNAQYGARSLKRAIQHHIEDALCDFMLENPTATHLTTCVKDKGIVIVAE